ncbi:MAG: hydrogenase maturation nickel metallochaperone HypA [Oscillospiraceae bacterium]|nr:hydrogenase maturation nickel metallochaperone HypA [Oscillospiraceae bacterium]
MHELALTEGIVDIVRTEQAKGGFTRCLAIRLRIGEFSGVVPECLREFFPIASKGTPAEGAALEIETVPAAFRCLSCGFEGSIDRKAARCPRCGSSDIRMTAGREFYVENLKVE